MDEHRTQNIALSLIIFAVVSIAIGEYFHWQQLVDFALTFGGGGVGILTGQKMTQTSTKGGGPIVNNNDQPKETV